MSNLPLVSHQHSITRTKSAGEIPITEVLQWIKEGKYSEAVSHVRRLKSSGASPEAVGEAKKKLPTYTPYGTFSYRNSSSTQTYSNVCFIDIDGKRNEHLRACDTKSKLESLPFVFAVYQSATGTGFHALASLDSINDDYQPQTVTEAANIIYELVESETELKCDRSCSDVSRACYISHDENLFFDISRMPEVTNLKAEKVQLGRNESFQIQSIAELTAPFSLRYSGPVEPIDFGDSQYVHFPDGKPFFKVWLADTRCGHRKKSLYAALAQLCIGNPDVEEGGVRFVANYLNSKFEKALEKFELDGVVKSVMKRKIGTGFTTNFTKKVFFNPEARLSAKQKQSISAVKTAEMKRANTMAKITNAVEELKREGVKPTQKEVAVRTGLSIRTVKTYLRKKGSVE